MVISSWEYHGYIYCGYTTLWGRQKPQDYIAVIPGILFPEENPMVFFPEIGHPMVSSHGDYTHGITMGTYNPMVFFRKLATPMVSPHGNTMGIFTMG